MSTIGCFSDLNNFETFIDCARTLAPIALVILFSSLSVMSLVSLFILDTRFIIFAKISDLAHFPLNSRATSRIIIFNVHIHPIQSTTKESVNKVFKQRYLVYTMNLEDHSHHREHAVSNIRH